MESFPQTNSRNFQITGKYYSKKRDCKKPDWIKIKWSWGTLGISIYSESESRLEGGEWENRPPCDSTCATYKGNIIQPNVTVSITLNATVSGLCKGIPFSKTVSVTNFLT